jgi:acyl carrier protein
MGSRTAMAVVTDQEVLRTFVLHTVRALAHARPEQGPVGPDGRGPAAPPVPPVSEASDLQADVGLSSVELVELCCTIRDGVGVDPAAADLACVRTVADLQALVERLVAAAGAVPSRRQMAASLRWLASPAPRWTSSDGAGAAAPAPQRAEPAREPLAPGPRGAGA